MNPFFTVLSAAYIFMIFYGADSSAVSQVGDFNPDSLLHIPLYGILTLLLILALRPNDGRVETRRLIGAGLIALVVAVLDEYYQTFIPIREGSITDVILDGVGIGLAMGLGVRYFLPALDRVGKRIWK